MLEVAPVALSAKGLLLKLKSWACTETFLEVGPVALSGKEAADLLFDPKSPVELTLLGVAPPALVAEAVDGRLDPKGLGVPKALGVALLALVAEAVGGRLDPKSPPDAK